MEDSDRDCGGQNCVKTLLESIVLQLLNNAWPTNLIGGPTRSFLLLLEHQESESEWIKKVSIIHVHCEALGMTYSYQHDG